MAPKRKMNWKVGDWVVFDRSVGQIKELRDDGTASFSDGFFETSGRLTDRFRPLTLPNKRIVETFETIYNRLREIDGESGFNYPDINSYFSHLALQAIDCGKDESKEHFDKAREFVQAAWDYSQVIQGIRLFHKARP